MADGLMSKSAQLYVQTLEEKLHLAETSLRKAEASLTEKKQDIQTLRTEAQKSWSLVTHMMRTFRKGRELMKAREGLVVAQAAKLKQVEKEVTDYKEFVATNMANLITGSSVGTEAGLAQEFRETFFEQLLLLAISVA